jgi:hypothetical protein
MALLWKLQSSCGNRKTVHYYTDSNISSLIACDPCRCIDGLESLFLAK